MLKLEAVEEKKHAVRRHAAPINQVAIKRLVARKNVDYLKVAGPYSHVSRHQCNSGENNVIAELKRQDEKRVSDRDQK